MKPLQEGDAIGIVSPASLAEARVYRMMAEIAEGNGFRLKVFGAGDVPFGRMSATDGRRLAHLREAFRDDDIRAVLCARGGYGSGRLLDIEDPDTFRDKIFVGYSDVTNLLCHLGKHSGLIPFHGPMAADLIRNAGPLTHEWLFSTLRGERLSYGLERPAFQVFRSGTARGPVFGGNIAILETLLGTDSFEIPEGAILLLEDINVFMYALDRSLVHLRRAGVFDRVSGILFGGLGLRDGGDRDNSLGLLLDEVLDAHFGGFGGPVAYGLPFGHTVEQMTVPLGAPASLTVGQEELRLEFDDYWERPDAIGLAA